MAHFARVVDGVVVEVIVADQDVIDSGLFGKPLSWIQTSYNTHGGQHPEGKPLRKNFAEIGGIYDSIRDAFIPRKTFASWHLNEETCLWEPPIPYPNDGNLYSWDEIAQNWKQII